MVCSILTGPLQYTSVAFEHFCATQGITQSEGRVVTCYDNAVTESFSPLSTLSSATNTHILAA